MLPTAVGQPRIHVPHDIHYTIGYDVGDSGEYAFSRVRQLFADDKYFYVVDDKSPVVRFYDLASGSYAGTLGTRGEGPQEFQDVYSGSVFDGLLWLFDRQLQKIEVYRGGVHERTLRISDDDFKAPQSFMIMDDSNLVMHSTLNDKAAVECIDLFSRQRSCAWLDLETLFDPDRYPFETDRSIGPKIHIAIVSPDLVYVVTNTYDGLIRKVSLEDENARVENIPNTSFADEHGYLARNGIVYDELDLSQYYSNDLSPREGVALPYHHVIYSDRSQKMKMWNIYSWTISHWYSQGEGIINVAYVLYRDDLGTDLIIDRVNVESNGRRSIKIASWNGLGNGGIINIYQLDNRDFIIAWEDQGIPVVSRVGLDIGK